MTAHVYAHAAIRRERRRLETVLGNLAADPTTPLSVQSQVTTAVTELAAAEDHLVALMDAQLLAAP